MTRDPRLAPWADETEPTTTEMDRVRRRVRKSLAPRPRDHRPLLAGAGLVLAAAAAIAVVAWPSGSDPIAPPGDEPIAATLSADAPTQLVASQAVHLVYDGSGSVGGTEKAPRITWDSGAITVEVQPGLGIDLRVGTPEAEVRVIGTGFTVTRDLLGSHVVVLHGVVGVTCADGTDLKLPAGSEHTCLPVRGAGLLARARALESSGAAPDVILETIRRGLAVETSGTVYGELVALEAAVLARAGRDAEALAAARRYLASGDDLRRADVRRLAAQLALRIEGCEGALPLLREQDAASAEYEATVALAECLPAGRERDAALDRAAALALTDAEREAVERRREKP